MEEKSLVLLVDDEEGTRASLRELLEKEGFRVAEASDGTSAMAAVRDLSPDLVLLDVVMPGLTGLEVCRLLKANQGQRFLPVILLTAKNDLDSRVQGLRMGADDYLSKPANPRELLARMEALLRIKKLQDRMSQNQKRLEDQAVTDPATGLFNARYLSGRLHDEFARAERYKEPLSCLAIGLDNVLDLARDCGAGGPEAVVRECARILEQMVREFDILTRPAADRFVLILPRTHFTGSLAVASRILARLESETFTVSGKVVLPRFSLGAAFYPNKDVTSAELLLAQLEDALRQARQAGGRQICLYQHTTYFYRPESGK